MSEDKIDRIDRRLNELVNVTGNLVIAFRGLNDKIDAGLESVNARLDKMDVRLDKMDARLDKMDGRMDTTNAILEDALGRIIDLQKGQEEIGNLKSRLEIVEDKLFA